MLEIPVIRWGQPYESLEKDTVVHFETGEVLDQRRFHGRRIVVRGHDGAGQGLDFAGLLGDLSLL